MNATNSTLYIPTASDYGALALLATSRTVIIVVSFVMLVLCFVFRNKQPLKSRRLTPYLFLVFKIISSYSYLPDGIYTEAYYPTTSPLYQSMCFIRNWTAAPIRVAVFLVFDAAFARYFLIRLANNRKEQAQEDIKQSAIKNRFNVLNIANFLLKDAVVIVFLFVCVFVIYAVAALELGLRGGQCQYNSGAYYLFIQIIQFITALALVVMFIIDVLYAGYWDALCSKQKFKKAYLDEDPLIYRIELLGIVLWILVSVVQIAIVLILGSFKPTILASGWFFFASNGPVEVFGLLMTPGIVLFFTIKWRNRSRRLKNPNLAHLSLSEFNPCGDMIKLILEEHEDLAETFKKFTEKEFSVENVLAYRDVCAYQALDNNLDRIAHATRIFETYLDNSSPLEINVSSDLINAARKKISPLKSNKDFELDPALFDALLEQGIVVNLIDTYSRFFHWDQFKKYNAKRNKGKAEVKAQIVE